MARLAGPPPDPSTLRAGIPADLVAIDRKALATEPADRWSSASSMAAALEAFLAGTAVPGTVGRRRRRRVRRSPARGLRRGAAAAARRPDLAATSATARPNPGAIPYAPDAYADEPGRVAAPIRTPARRRPGGRGGAADHRPAGRGGRRGAGRHVAGGLGRRDRGPPDPRRGRVPRLPPAVRSRQRDAGRPGRRSRTSSARPSRRPRPSPPRTASPSARRRSPRPSGVDREHRPSARTRRPGTKIDTGRHGQADVAAGAETVAVPDLRGKTETEAFNLLAAAGLQIGDEDRGVRSGRARRPVDQPEPRGAASSSTRADADRLRPLEGPGADAAQPVARAHRRPRPRRPRRPRRRHPPRHRRRPRSPSPTTAARRWPRPGPRSTGDGLTVGTVTPQPAGYPGGEDAIVIEQDPTPGKKVAPGTADRPRRLRPGVARRPARRDRAGPAGRDVAPFRHAEIARPRPRPGLDLDVDLDLDFDLDPQPAAAAAPAAAGRLGAGRRAGTGRRPDSTSASPGVCHLSGRGSSSSAASRRARPRSGGRAGPA